MKKLVVFGYTMDMGGAERALINVLNILKENFEIDLILIRDKGVLMKDIPSDVNVKVIRKGIFGYILFRFIPFFRKRKIRSLTKKKYDVAVAFMEGRAATWLCDMNQNCKKIAWIHNDVNLFDIGISEKEIISTYNKVDKVAIVSKQSQDSFCKKYNIPIDKTEVVYNLLNEEEIIKKSNLLDIKTDKFTFINVSKMRPQKNHMRLLKAVSILKKKGYDFELWLVGNGPLEDKIKNEILNLDIKDYVKLLGLKENPFPYIKACDFFVMSSDHEGYPLSLLESLLLKTPVLSTDVSGAAEILKNGKYGIICERNLESLTKSMEQILKKKRFPNILKNIDSYEGSNEEIIEQLKELFLK